MASSSSSSTPASAEPPGRTAAADRCGYCALEKRPEGVGDPLATGLCRCPNASDSSDPGIRLGAVPSSAFRRSPSPRPPSSVGVTGATPAEILSGATKYEIVSIREKHGDFRKAVPHMPLPLALFLCFLNVLLPGTGTLVSSFTVLCGCATEHPDRGRSLGYNLLAALLQVLLAPIIVGWIWSVLWGITFVNISVSKAVEEPDPGSLV